MDEHGLVEYDQQAKTLTLTEKGEMVAMVHLWLAPLIQNNTTKNI
jgi:Mn-dependent DtxR family transcriptional regulator